MNYNTVKQFKILLIASGLFNIIFALPLLIPEVSNLYLEVLSNINVFLGLGGEAFSIPINSIHSLLINTAGIDLVLIGVIILICSKEPLKNTKIIAANAIGRTIFFFVIGYHILANNLIRLVLVFGIIDLIISILFIYFVLKTKPKTVHK